MTGSFVKISLYTCVVSQRLPKVCFEVWSLQTLWTTIFICYWSLKIWMLQPFASLKFL